MISGDFTKCETLSEFYDSIRSCHEKAHGKDYCLVHDEICKRVSNKTYIELGINQGATLAGALLEKPHTIYGIDRNISNVKPYQQMMVAFAAHNKIDFSIIESSSIDKSILQKCDVLYVDTTHRWEHLKKELDLWESHVQETIIIHDTHSCRMSSPIDNWVKKHPEWTASHNTQNVGYSVLERK